MREEFYYNLRFAGLDRPTSSLLEVPRLGGRKPNGDVVAWARERSDGGRGFGTTCGHFYDNWKNDDFRKFVLNAIVWTAKVDVPSGGVEAPFFSHEEIETRLNQKNEVAGDVIRVVGVQALQAGSGAADAAP